MKGKLIYYYCYTYVVLVFLMMKIDDLYHDKINDFLHIGHNIYLSAFARIIIMYVFLLIVMFVISLIVKIKYKNDIETLEESRFYKKILHKYYFYISIIFSIFMFIIATIFDLN